MLFLIRNPKSLMCLLICLSYSCIRHIIELYSRLELLNSSSIDIIGCIIFMLGELAESVFYPKDDRSNISKLWQPKIFQDIVNYSPWIGTKLCPSSTENCCSREKKTEGWAQKGATDCTVCADKCLCILFRLGVYGNSPSLSLNGFQLVGGSLDS